MAEGFDAGSIFVALKAQISDLQKGLNSAKGMLDQFGTKTQQTAQGVKGAGSTIGATFDTMDKQSIKLTERIAKFTNRMVGLQFAISALGQTGKDKFGAFSRVADAAQASLTTFAATVSLLPNKIGLVTGAVAGLTVGLQNLTKVSDRVQAVIDATVLQTVTLGDRIRNGLNREMSITGRLSAIFGTTAEKPGDLAEARVDVVKKEIEFFVRQAQQELPKQLAEFEEWRAGLFGSQRDNVIARGMRRLNLTDEKDFEKALNEAIETTRENIRAANLQVRDLETELKGFQGAAIREVRAQLIQEAQKSTSDLNNAIKVGLEGVERTGAMMLERGLITPLDLISEKANAAKQALDKLIDQRDALNRLKPGFGDTQLGSDIGLAMHRAKKSRDVLDRAIDVQRMGDNFGAAVGQGLRDGILSGASAMETLANIGRNLFENFVNDAVSKLQTNLTAAFTAVAGTAGQIFGQVLTGVLGIVGLFLSRGKSSSTSSFDTVGGQIETTTPVRGVIAGPQSVAVAAVGEDLKRANADVVVRLDALIQIGQRALSAMRGTGPGAPAAGFQFAGTAPTT